MLGRAPRLHPTEAPGPCGPEVKGSRSGWTLAAHDPSTPRGEGAALRLG